ncbi:DNA-binding protein [Streptomyces sp. NPDC059697]|uniref:nSTAND1 domain-containing NTPase n=1 Tax=Streptomyces sp. NPDC059697 TaxID=3346912 RepID=UPI0036AB2F27
MAGRQESPLDPSAGPVARFAAELRKLRAEAGSPTYRVMAQRTGQGASTLSQAAAGERLPTLSVVVAYVRACGGDPGEWEGRWREAAAEAAAEPRAEEEDAEPPYRGLARFEPADANLFFGRDELTDRLFQQACIGRFTAVFGPSGSGKSSLLRAGLIPRLRTLEPAGPRPGALRVLTPGQHPMRTHAQRLVPAEGNGHTWLIVDQFEELYTLCTEPAERDQFIDQLLASTDPASRLHVVIAVRADFLGHCAQHPQLTAALQEGTVLAGPMIRDELREAIIKPAQCTGLIVERALTATLLNEVEGEPGALPLMSHALLETWRRRKGRALTLEAYQVAGGLHGAIARTAEDLYTQLPPAQADLARRLLLRLVTPGDGTRDTRRPAPRGELAAAVGSGELEAVLDQLVRARLLTVDEDVVDLAHESLLTAWPRLHSWVEEDRERLRVHRRLTEAAATWHDLNRDPGTLYRGIRLASAEELWPPAQRSELTPLECAFLTSSLSIRDQEQRAAARTTRRLRQFTATVAVLLVLALIGGVLAWQQTRTSGRRHVEAEARRIAAVADSMRFSDPVRAMQLSVAAWKLTDTTETRSALLGAMAQREEDVFAIPGADNGYSDGSDFKVRRLIDDGSAVVSVEPDRIRIWDLHTHRLTHSYRGPGKLMANGAPAVSPDGRMLALTDPDGAVLWDVQAARAKGKLSGSSWTTDMAFGPGGRTLVVDSQGESGSSSVEVWHVADRRLLLQLPVTEEEMAHAALSEDDRWLALCTDRKPIQLWDLAKHRKASLPWAAGLGRRTCPAAALAFGPDSRTIAIVTDNAIRRWDLRRGRELARIKEDGISGMWFSPDGKFLVTVDANDLLLWRLSYPDAPVFRQPVHVGEISDLQLDTASGTLRYLSGAGTIVRSLSLEQVTTARWEEQTADQAQLADGGRTLARFLPTAETHSLQVLDARGRVVFAPTVQHCPKAQPDCADFTALSDDGRYLAFSHVDSSESTPTKRQLVTVWDTRRDRTYTTLNIGPDWHDDSDVQSIALDARGRTLAVYRSDTSLDVWDLHRKKRTKHVSAEPARTYMTTTSGEMGANLVFRADTNILVALDGTVIDLRAGQKTHRLLDDDQASTLAFSPDRAYLAVGDVLGRVTLWDGALHKRLGVLSGTSADVQSQDDSTATALAFSHDGRTLAVGGSNGSVQLWDVASRRPLGSAIPTPGDAVLSLTFTPDDKSIYIAGANVPVQKHDIDSAALVERICQRVGSGLSRADWRSYLPDIAYRKTCRK